MSSPKVRVTTVDHEVFTEYDFIAPATFYFKNAMGEYIFLHTSKRAVAQEWIDHNMGSGRYSVVAAKLQSNNKKSEGGLSCRGTATRKH